MRTLPLALALSPLAVALAAACMPAAAQDAVPDTPVRTTQPVDATQQVVPDAAQLPAGAAAEPSIQTPGLVTGIKLGELYTDNVRLAGDGQSKDARFITVVRPFVKAAWNRPRLTAVFNATLSGYVYAGHSDENQLAEHLNTHGTLAMVPQHLYLDGAASYGRQIINNAAPAGGTFFLNNNRANVATAMLSPYWVQNLGRVGTMTLRYSEGRVAYNTHGIKGTSGNELVGISDITTYGLNFSIVSPKDEIWGWKLLYSGERLKPDGRESLRFARAMFELSRQISLHGRVLADVGKENHYYPDGRVATLGAKFWDAGYQWSDTRNFFELRGGHHFYGRSARVAWTHNAARLTTHVGYEEHPTDLNQQLMANASGLNASELSAPNLNVPQGISGVPSLFERRIYLMKRASASADYTMATSQLTVALYNEQRDFFLQGTSHETVSDVHAAWRFDLGPFTTLTPTVGWQRYRFRDQQVNHTNYEQLEFVHQISRSDFLSVRVRHASRNVDAVVPNGHGYKVNVLYASWTHLFGQS